ncbi:hypothetical protein LTR91_026277 [Friedmanniomyces endolithicus]|uniref:Threonyl/alanyl tRNA synthetase SAD domain-containing protein n=1 Tax=Friedmanniomyces endolithicus TaxID=329885 RepID=A0AAN6GYM3_9PEZI|nr:hypothetical protein LTR57_025371 [Friedmanniomyces endolithicus]KAK0949652.1 hypothetical protein LTR91_026277 [Friedmanniomyces endolithicus]KAK0954783.1 hypothetical protein LTS01_023739 [Friedmanniomyces endolithicus]KAK1027007.1 hypothetical protein LTS16_021819 [Friedmanniomyces endolithicus]
MSASGIQSDGDGQTSTTCTGSDVAKTKLIFHSAQHQQTYEQQTSIVSLSPLASLPEADQGLFKLPQEISAPIFAITTGSTIFHPQGGGQPSDIGELLISQDGTQLTFNVLTVRTSATNSLVVLHFGHFATDPPPTQNFSGASVKQLVNPDKRQLFSRLHTAGHVLGAATRTLLEDKVENLDELKYKPEIQHAVDEMVSKDAEVRIAWWTKADFLRRGLGRLVPSDEDWRAIAIAVDEEGLEQPAEDGAVDDERTRIRVVDIVGSEVYPCGGTHVSSTKQCGKVTVKKISRQKGNSRVSYLVD